MHNFTIAELIQVFADSICISRFNAATKEEAVQKYVAERSNSVVDPNAEFSEAKYLENYPDVADAVGGGSFVSGYHHYLIHGQTEGRLSFAAGGVNEEPAEPPAVAQVPVPVKQAKTEPEAAVAISAQPSKEAPATLIEPTAPKKAEPKKAEPKKAEPKKSNTTRAGRIEKLVAKGNLLSLSGWAWAQTGVESIRLRITSKSNVERLCSVGTPRYRPDVKRSGHGDGLCGFSINVDLGEEIQEAADIAVHLLVEGETSSLALKCPTELSADLHSTSLDIEGDELTLSFDSPALLSDQSQLFIVVDRKVWLPLSDLPKTDKPEAKPDWDQKLPAARASISIQRLLKFVRARSPANIPANTGVRVFSVYLDSTYLAEASFKSAGDKLGSIDNVSEGAPVVRGWIAPVKETNVSACMVSLRIDGVEFTDIRASRTREDLIRKGIVKSGGGFEFKLSRTAPSSETSYAVSVHSESGEYDVPSKHKQINFSLPLVPPKPMWQTALAASELVTIIIPVYNAPDEVEACIESVLKNTRGEVRLLIVDDCSPDPRIKPLLKKYSGKKNISVVHNQVNIGYTKTVNKAILLAPKGDVILLNSDTVVPKNWLLRLRTAAYSSPNVGTVTPFSTNAGAYSAPDMGMENPAVFGYSFDEVAMAYSRAALGLSTIAPTGHGFCFYITRNALQKVGLFDEILFPRGYGEENDFSLRVTAAGLENILDDKTYVYHKRSASFGTEKGINYFNGQNALHQKYPEYRVLTRMFKDDHGLNSTRWALRKQRQTLASDYQAVLPRVLFVISTQTGGTPQTNQDLMSALLDRCEAWVLRCDSQTLFISKWTGEEMVAIESVEMAAPLVIAKHDSFEYQNSVAYLLRKYEIDIVHIRHLAWHGLSLPKVAKRMGLPVIYSLHDYYSVCPTVKLIDGEGKHCRGNCSAANGTCKAELWGLDTVPELRDRFVHKWRDMFRQVFEQCDAFVTTDQTGKDIIVEAYPELNARRFDVIPHGRNFESMDRGYEIPSDGSPLKILVPGNVSAAKGIDLIKATTAVIKPRTVEFHLLGDAPKSWSKSVIAHGKYQRAEFVDRVRGIRPHVGAVLSIWPETYCHTLTELWASGLPVIAIDVGAVGERIKRCGGGWLLPLGSTETDLINLIEKIRSDIDDYLDKCRAVAIWQRNEGRFYSTKAMSVRYATLYRDVIQGKNSFGRKPKTTGVALTLLKPTEGQISCAAEDDFKRRYANSFDRDLVYFDIDGSWIGRDGLEFKASSLIVSPLAIEDCEWDALFAWARRLKIPVTIDLSEGGLAHLLRLDAPALDAIAASSSKFIVSVDRDLKEITASWSAIAGKAVLLPTQLPDDYAHEALCISSEAEVVESLKKPKTCLIVGTGLVFDSLNERAKLALMPRDCSVASIATDLAGFNWRMMADASGESTSEKGCVRRLMARLGDTSLVLVSDAMSSRRDIQPFTKILGLASKHYLVVSDDPEFNQASSDPVGDASISSGATISQEMAQEILSRWPDLPRFLNRDTAPLLRELSKEQSAKLAFWEIQDRVIQSA